MINAEYTNPNNKCPNVNTNVDECGAELPHLPSDYHDTLSLMATISNTSILEDVEMDNSYD